MGKRLKAKVEEVQANIQRLYNNLGNIAFWDAAAKTAAAPTQLDWGNPKHTVTVNLVSLSHATIKHNGSSVTNGQTFQVEEGSSLVLSVEADDGYTMNSVTASGATIAPDLSTITVNMSTSNITINVSASAVSDPVVTIDDQVGAGIVIKNGNDVLTDGDTVPVAMGGTLTLTVEAAENHIITSLDATVNGNSLSPTLSNGVYTIVASNVSSDIEISITGVVGVFFPRKAAQINNKVINNAPKRACLLVPNALVASQTQWGTHDNSDEPALMAAYSLIPVPSGATVIKYKMTTVGIDVTLVGSAATLSPLFDTTWQTSQDVWKTIDLTQYSGVTQFSVQFKHSDNTEFNLTDTLKDLGIDLQIEFE